MPTANFNLPLIDPAAPISIVNDLNSLATATDSAMGTLATAGDIAAVRQLATNASTLASDANTTAEAAKAGADTANAAAVSAVSAANASNATAQAAAQQANTITATFNDTFNFTQVKKIEQSGNVSIYLTVLVNANRTLFKCYGFVRVKANNSLSLVAIPGSTRYGYKVDIGGILTKGTEAITVGTGGLVAWDNTSSAFSNASTNTLLIGTDGNIYVADSGTSTLSVSANNVFLAQYPACIYINANLGDSPIPISQS